MSLLRPALWSAVLLVAASTAVLAQEPSLQKLLETGQYDAVVERGAEGRSGSPEEIFAASMAFIKMGNRPAAAEEFRRLQEQGDEAWKQVGGSGVAMIENNEGEAVAAANRATELGGDNPYAHYQLGMAAAAANDFATSARALAHATELKPDFAYAHYYAAQAFHKQRNLSQAAQHYEYFLRLAPEAPERGAVQAIMRTLRR